LVGSAQNPHARVFEGAADALRKERIVVEDQELLVAQEAVDVIAQVARDLRHEVARSGLGAMPLFLSVVAMVVFATRSPTCFGSPRMRR
tara:strand:+ start:353 stop:619 length:267 start_codon:yes stop_codon:yes gene_type:complete